MDRGLVLNIQRYCLHDGPGIRTTVFLKGCPLRCSWCHNPESQRAERSVGVVTARCLRCGQCAEVCPQGDAQVASDACQRCGACVDVCPSGARQFVGREMTAAELVDELLADRQFHDQSGGGVTISGGEPLAQAPFVLDLLKRLRAHSVHAAIDTCGFAVREVIQEIASWVDLILYDLKSVDDAAHRQETGVSNALILKNLQTLGACHANIWIRVPLVPGFNMDDAQLRESARFVASIPGVRQVNLLPYHALGQHKSAWTSGHAANRNLGGARKATISEQQIDRAAELFRAAGLRTFIGG